jgi:predicted MFS family arabinose efflux permease
MKRSFTRYESFLIAILTFLQFTAILDFMVLSPLGAILMPELNITTTQFGVVVSAYAWSAGISGLLAAGFADRFDRKKMLIFFYSGFIIGTFLCGIANSYSFLLVARIITGIFGGVMGSITYAIVTDVFPLEVRGRVMGFLQMAFAGAVVLGLPIGMYLADKFDWHATFLLIVALCVLILVIIILYVKPVDAHITGKSERKAVEHLIRTVSNLTYGKAFTSTILVATAGFMLMPFGSAFVVYNNGIDIKYLAMVYLVNGVIGMVAAPMIGKLADSMGKYIVFCICSVIMIGAVVIHSNLGIIPLWIVMVLSTLAFIGYAGRMISSSALLTAIPESSDRGAFMSINSAVNMMSGGIASLIGGAIVHQVPETNYIVNYDVLGYMVAGATVITVIIMYFIDQMVKNAARLRQAQSDMELKTQADGLDIGRQTSTDSV